MKVSVNSITAMLAVTSELIAPFAHAESSDPLQKALIDDATPYIDLRHRFENVDQTGLAKEANASTLRTKLGYKTGKFYDFATTLEFENVVYLGNDNFNNTINGKTAYPIVADPDSTEVNHAYLTYTGIPDTTLQVGRQPHNLDNQRFIGTVGWRQNDQTYDSAAFTNTSLPDTTLFYSYVDNVNRIFSDDHPLGNLNMHTHIINVTYAGIPYGKLTGYGYLIDIDNAAAFTLSSKTFGLRFAGDTEAQEGVKLLYTAEYARQGDYKDNPTSYNVNYYTLEGGIEYTGVTAKLGYEVLGSDNGTTSFQTPLATLHTFNGWADKFLTTPATGLEDLYASVSYKVDGVDGTQLTVVYHDFSAETGGADYGSEWNASVGRNFLEHYSVLLKYANYNAESFTTNTQKVWLQLGAKF